MQNWGVICCNWWSSPHCWSHALHLTRLFMLLGWCNLRHQWFARMLLCSWEDYSAGVIHLSQVGEKHSHITWASNTCIYLLFRQMFNTYKHRKIFISYVPYLLPSISDKTSSQFVAVCMLLTLVGGGSKYTMLHADGSIMKKTWRFQNYCTNAWICNVSASFLSSKQVWPKWRGS